MSRAKPGSDNTADVLLLMIQRDYMARLAQATSIIRRYFWCQSRVEGRRIDEDAMKFLDANGGREEPR